MTTPTITSPARVFGRPTSGQLWLGPAQRQALGFLRTPMGEKTKLLLGRADTGKSVLLEHQLRDTGNTVSFRSRGAHGSPAALLNALLESGGVATMESSDVAQRNLLVSFLQHQRSLGLDITIAIDRAERLTSDLWRELSRLREIKYEGEYWPNFVLIGRPETYSHMQAVKNSGWESVNVAVHHLPAPGPDDINEYISHRLETAGLPKRVFSPTARELIATLSGGSFAWVNILCQWALVLARQRSIFQVDEQLVVAARAVIHSRLAVRGELVGGQAVTGDKAAPASINLNEPT